jgi:hypothetical protein
MRIHEPRERHERIPRHDAVGVQDHEVVVGAAPIAHEVGDVARLPAEVLHAAAVEDAPLGLVARHERAPGALLGRADLGRARVGENEKIEGSRVRLCKHRGPDGVDAGGHPSYILVVNWHDDRGTRRERRVRPLRAD